MKKIRFTRDGDGVARRASSPAKRGSGVRGFSLLEALLLVVVLGITAVATGQALMVMAKSPQQNEYALEMETYALDKMEFLRGLSFSTLAQDVNKYPSAYTDTVTIGGVQAQRVVSIAYVVPDTGALSGSPTHMLKMTVTVNGATVATLMNEP